MQTTRPIGYSGEATLYLERQPRPRYRRFVCRGGHQRQATGSLDKRADLSDPSTTGHGRSLAYSVNYLTNEYHPLGGAIAKDLQTLPAVAAFSVTSQSPDNQVWTTHRSWRPALEYWLYDPPVMG